MREIVVSGSTGLKNNKYVLEDICLFVFHFKIDRSRGLLLLYVRQLFQGKTSPQVISLNNVLWTKILSMLEASNKIHFHVYNGLKCTKMQNWKYFFEYRTKRTCTYTRSNSTSQLEIECQARLSWTRLYVQRSAWCRALRVPGTGRNHYSSNLIMTVNANEVSWMIMPVHMLLRWRTTTWRQSIGKPFLLVVFTRYCFLGLSLVAINSTWAVWAGLHTIWWYQKLDRFIISLKSWKLFPTRNRYATRKIWKSSGWRCSGVTLFYFAEFISWVF